MRLIDGRNLHRLLEILWIDLEERGEYAKQDGVHLALKVLEKQMEQNLNEVIRCKNCDYYAGDGMYCVMNVIAYDDAYCMDWRNDG